MNENIEEEVELCEVNSAWWKMEDEKLKHIHPCGRVGIEVGIFGCWLTASFVNYKM